MRDDVHPTVRSNKQSTAPRSNDVHDDILIEDLLRVLFHLSPQPEDDRIRGGEKWGEDLGNQRWNGGVVANREFI